MKWGVTEKKAPKSRNSFACFPAILSKKILSTEVMMMFLLPPEAEIKDMPIQRTYSPKKFLLFAKKKRRIKLIYE